MKTTKLEKLSENEMSQIKGGSEWIWVDDHWVLVSTLDLGDDDYEGM